MDDTKHRGRLLIAQDNVLVLGEIHSDDWDQDEIDAANSITLLCHAKVIMLEDLTQGRPGDRHEPGPFTFLCRPARTADLAVILDEAMQALLHN